jgi:ATP-dependent RNA helicase MSS116
MAQAKTGTGKTLAFLIPAIHHLLNRSALPAKSSTSVLVLSPTRELASQIGVAAEGLIKDTGLGIQTVIGGTNIKTDVKHLQSRRYVPLFNFAYCEADVIVRISSSLLRVGW